MGQDPVTSEHEIRSCGGRFRQLTEPPCSYCSTHDRKGIVAGDDRVSAWLRARQQGGAIPVRQSLAVPRVINDTYGLFVYDADGDYGSAFEEDYGDETHGWRRGVMVIRGRDGTLYSALTGLAFEGPQAGHQFRRIPSMQCTWGHWLMLHPESTTYDMFDGKRYPGADLATELSAEARASMGDVDGRLRAMTLVLGVRVGDDTMVFPLADLPQRAVFQDTIGGWSVVVFWYGPSKTAVAWRRVLDDRRLEFRAVDGLLRHRELVWVESVQCRWFAWVAEQPQTRIDGAANSGDEERK
jgi:hypothetical protein